MDNSKKEEPKEEDEFCLGRKRKLKRINERKAVKKLKLEREKKINDYYNSVFYGEPTSQVLYTLALQLNKDNNELLWWSIVGLTEMFLHNKFNHSTYQIFAAEAQKEVFRHNQMIEEGNNENFDILNYNAEEIKVDSQNKRNGTIFIESDMRLMLMRHWNLYESLFYSDYFATKLDLYSQNGEKNLLKFIARLGISIEEAKQKHKYLTIQTKDKITEEMFKIASEENSLIHDLLFNSFVKQVDSKLQINAADIVHAVSSVLINPKKFSEEEKRNEEDLSTDFNNMRYNLGSQSRNRNFWWAFELIRNNDFIEINESLKMAIEFQKALINEAILNIEKRAMKLCTQFKYLIIKSETLQEAKFFNHPLALQKLAYVIYDLDKKKRKNDQKPLVLACLNNKTQLYTIIGINKRNVLMNDIQENFGKKFYNAAEECKLKINFDDLETGIIEVHQDDFSTFIERLVTVH